MDFLQAMFHDEIIRASASTYDISELSKAGLEITLNLSGKKVRSLGELSNPIYPELIVWKPDYPNSVTGTAVTIEAIETESTIDLFSANKWKRLSDIGIAFYLIIPETKIVDVKRMLITYSIKPTHLQTYKYDIASKKYIFTKAD